MKLLVRSRIFVCLVSVLRLKAAQVLSLLVAIFFFVRICFVDFFSVGDICPMIFFKWFHAIFTFHAHCSGKQAEDIRRRGYKFCSLTRDLAPESKEMSSKGFKLLELAGAARGNRWDDANCHELTILWFPFPWFFIASTSNAACKFFCFNCFWSSVLSNSAALRHSSSTWHRSMLYLEHRLPNLLRNYFGDSLFHCEPLVLSPSVGHTGKDFLFPKLPLGST